jgi:hypothetical protein
MTVVSLLEDGSKPAGAENACDGEVQPPLSGEDGAADPQSQPELPVLESKFPAKLVCVC